MKLQDTINTVSSVLDQLVCTKINPAKISRLKSANNVVIELDPKGVGNGYVKCQAVSLEYSDNTWATMGYISDFRGTGEDAIMIHGTKNGDLTLTSSVVKFRFTVKGFINYLQQRHAIDLALEKTKPLHVISCFGVSNGVYQGFSDALQRTVIGYGDGGAIAAKTELKYHLNIKTSKIKSVKSSTSNVVMKTSNLISASVITFKPNTK